MRKLTHEEIVGRQQAASGPALPFCVVLDNIRSLQNVGAIFRTADGAGMEKVWLCGITGYPPSAQLAKTALGAQERVPWDYREDGAALVRELKTAGYQIVVLEQTDASISYELFEPQAPVALIVGNEVEGVSEALVSMADAAVDIPMAGLKNSLNAAVAFGVAAYHIRQRILSGKKSRRRCGPDISSLQ